MTQAAPEDSRLTLVGVHAPKAGQPAEKGEPTPDGNGQPRAAGTGVGGQGVDGSGTGTDTQHGGNGGGNRRRIPRIEVTSRVVQGAVMTFLGIALAVSILSLGNADMLYLLPVLIGALALCSQGWLYMTTAEEPRRHDPNARRQAGIFQLLLGFAMALAMLKYGDGDRQLVVLGYTSGFLIFVFGWKLYFQRPVARTD